MLEEVSHPSIFAFSFMRTVHLDILVLSNIVFHLLYSREVCDLDAAKAL